MKFQDIPVNIITVRIKRSDNVEALQEQPVFSVEASLSRADEFEIRLRDAVVFVRPVAAVDIRRLNAELASGRSLLAQLENPAADGSIELKIGFFTGVCLEMGDVEIGVDEYVQEKMRTKGEALYKRLGELCCFQQGNDAFFFLTAGPAIDEELKPVGEDTPRDAAAEPTRINAFCVTGEGIRFIATEKAMPGGQTIYIATRLTKPKKEPDRTLRLAKGRLRFVDWTQAGQVQILAKAQMTALTQDDGSYLKKWDEFGEVEGELLLKQAREVGALQFTEMVPKRDGTVGVRIAQASDSAWGALRQGAVPEVELVDELPDYLQDENLSFTDFARGIEKKEGEHSKLGEKRELREKNTYFSVAEFDEETRVLTLKAEALPKEFGTLILSLAGESAQIKRRMAARQAILEGRAANPQLGLLIEAQGRITQIRPSQKVQPLTAFVRNKVFRNPPTVMQEKGLFAFKGVEKI